MSRGSTSKAAERLQASLGYQFSDVDLLTRALTHKSAGASHNERLEFIGDAILGFVVADLLFNAFPKAREDRLTLMRADLVKGDTLAEIAKEVGLPDALDLGSGERRSGGRLRSSIQADALEAVIGAAYLDGGIRKCRALVKRLLRERIAHVGDRDLKDAKTRLQEHLQGDGLSLPVYEVINTSGLDHEKQYSVACRIGDLDLETEGSGSSRRKAEQDAAATALERLTALEEAEDS